MCGTCESGHARRWTSTRVILVVFLATLLVLSSVGVASRLRSSDAQAVAAGDAASTAAVRFQSAVTRDLRSNVRLHADTTRFTRDVRSLAATGCPATTRFVRSAERTLDGLCGDCAVELRALGSAATSG